MLHRYSFVSYILTFEPYKLHFVFICYSYVFAIGFQISFFARWFSDNKVLVNHVIEICQIVVSKKLQTITNTIIDVTELIKIVVPESIGFSKYCIKNRVIYANIYRYTIEKSFSKELSEKVKYLLITHNFVRHLIDLISEIFCICLRKQHHSFTAYLLEDLLEKFSRETSSILTHFFFKLYVKYFFKVLEFYKLQHRILQKWFSIDRQKIYAFSNWGCVLVNHSFCVQNFLMGL
jgi:hypothetical protein